MKNKKLLELIIWLIIAVAGIVIILTGYNDPDKILDKGETANADYICFEYNEL